MKSFITILILTLFLSVAAIHAQTETEIVVLGENNQLLPTNTTLITPENAGQLELVAELGMGSAVDIIYIEEEQRFALLSTGGIWLYNTDDLAGQFIPFAKNYFGRARRGLFAVGNGEIFYHDGTLTVYALERLDPSEPPNVHGLRFDFDTGELVGQTILQDDVPRAVSPDGRYQAFLQDSGLGPVVIADTQTGEIFVIGVDDEEATGIVAFTSDSEQVITVSRAPNEAAKATLWDISTGEVVTQIDNLDQQAVTNAWVTDTFLAAPSEDGIIRVYDLQTGNVLYVLPDGEPIALSGTAIAYLTPDEEIVVERFTGETVMIDALRCRSVGLSGVLTEDRFYRLYVGQSGLIEAYNLEDGTLINSAAPPAAGFSDFVIDSDNNLRVAGGNFSPEDCSNESPSNGVVTFDLQTGLPTDFLASTIVAPSKVAHQNGLTAFVRARGFDVYDDNNALVASITNDDWSFFPSGLAFGDQHLALMAGSDAIYLYRLDDFDATPEIVTADEPFRSNFWGNPVAMYETTLIYMLGGQVVFRDVEADTEFTVQTPTDPGALYLQGDTLAVLTGNAILAEPQSVLLYELPSATLVAEIPLDSEASVDNTDVVLNPSGDLIAVSEPSGDSVFPGAGIYDIQTGERLALINALFLPAVFSPDGRFLIGSDGWSIVVYGIPE